MNTGAIITGLRKSKGWSQTDLSKHCGVSREMIGKYDQFKTGWDDYTGEVDLTPNRNHYEGLRHQSNVQFKRASYCGMMVIINHLLSAFDTAWTIKRHNRRVSGKMQMGLMKSNGNTSPCLALHVDW